MGGLAVEVWRDEILLRAQTTLWWSNSRMDRPGVTINSGRALSYMDQVGQYKRTNLASTAQNRPDSIKGFITKSARDINE